MSAFLANLGATIAGNALKLGFGLILMAGVGTGGFVWGESHAAAIAAGVAAKDADARVAAAQKSDQALLADYLGKISTETVRGDVLRAALAKDESQLAADAITTKEKISNAIPENASCDLPAAALGLLNEQPARR